MESIASSEITNEIKRLVDLIRYHNNCYFQEGVAEISDYAYDQLLERLLHLEEAYPHLKLADSPTEVVGEYPGCSVAYHQPPMLSLAKTYSEAEVAHFIARVRKDVSDPSIDFICELKIDGIALSVVYEKGMLLRVVTRGDGIQGDDITQHAIQFLKLPEKISNDKYQSFEVRGEAFMAKAVFERFNQERKAHGEPLWANPRNITTGTLKALDRDLVKGRQLEFYAYSFYDERHSCVTQQEALGLLTELGFFVTPAYKACHNFTEIMDYIHYWGGGKSDLPFGIDGIVIKVNGLHHQQAMGMTSKSPRWAIAYKYRPEMAQSILEKVTFQVGRTGAITPVAHFKPILLAGTVVRRASLYNADEMAKKFLYLNDTILVEKGGDIIPKVVGVDITRRNSASPPIVFAHLCPACGTLLSRVVGNVVYYCPNKRQCFPQLKGSLLHFAHRKAMDIDSLGAKTVDILLEAKLVKTAADLYTLRYEEVISLEGFKKVSTQKLLSNIQISKAKSFDKVLFALGIRYVGETVAKKLALYFKSMERLQRATETELLQLPDVGKKIVQSIFDYLQDPYQQELLMALQVAGLKFSVEEVANSAIQLPFLSKKFVISGAFQKWTRQELTKLIEQAGGRLLSSISANVDYLVAGSDVGPSKLTKAMELGIPILGEEDMMNML